MRIRRIISATGGGVLLLGIVIETWRQVSWFYEEHFVWPKEKYGILTPLRWQDIVFLAVLLVVAFALGYLSYRLIKYGLRSDRARALS